MKKRLLYIILGMLIANVSFADGHISFAGSESLFTYNGTQQTPFPVAGGCAYTSISYTYTGVSIVYGPNSTAPTNVGSYTVNAMLIGSGCGGVSTGNFSFTISKATPTVSITVGTYTYTGLSQGPSAAANTGTGNSYTFSYSGSGYGPSPAAPINVGTYTATATVAASGDGNYYIGSSAVNFTIMPAPLTIKAIGATKIYGESQSTTIANSTLFSSSGLQNGDTIQTVTLDFGSGAIDASDPVGSTSVITPSAPVGGTFTASNYTINYVNGTLTVVPATLTIAANSTNKVYGTTQSTSVAGSVLFNQTGLQNGETIGSVTLSYGLGAIAGNAVVGSTSVITPTVPVGGTFTASNYTINYANGTLTVVPATLTITANNINKVYGTTQITPFSGSTSFTPVGLQNDENIGTVTLDFGPVAIDASEPVGRVTSITPKNPVGGTFIASNYAITYITGLLTVVPAPLTIRIIAGQSKMYGANDPINFAYSLSTPLLGSDILNGSFVRVVGENIGTYAIGIGTIVNSNYAITFVGEDFTITAKPITINANAGQSKVYGDSDPASYLYTITPSITGLAPLTGFLSRAAGENVASYAIGIGTLANSNYEINYVGANYTITPKPITITANAGLSKVYGDSDPASFLYTITPSITGLAPLAGILSRVAGENVATYAIKQNNLTTETNPNYTISYVANNFKIEKKLINVIADAKSKNYNATDPPFTYNYSPMPLVGSDIFSGVLERVAGESAGVYDIKQGTLSLSSNYQLNFTKGLLTILPESNAYFQIPNAFVPGSSNELDNKFRIFKNSAFPDNLFKSLSIYNRNGQFLKRFDAITDSWDGRVDTVLQESDVYIWVLSLVDDPLTNNIPRSGTFLLLK